MVQYTYMLKNSPPLVQTYVHVPDRAMNLFYFLKIGFFSEENSKEMSVAKIKQHCDAVHRDGRKG